MKLFRQLPARYLLLCLFLSAARPALAQGDNLETARVEFTEFVWRVKVAGTVTARSAPIDLRQDLGIRQRNLGFVGKLVVAVAPRHRVVFSGVPYRFNGRNRLSRAFQFASRTYLVSEEIETRTEINQLFGAYQYDLVSRPRGHAGALVGVNYLDSTAVARSTTRNITETSSAKVPLPVFGFDFRRYLVPKRSLLNVNGEIRGMTLGQYGSYVEANGNIGLGIGRYFALQLGYRILDADVRRRSAGVGFAARFSGPTLSVQVRDR